MKLMLIRGLPGSGKSTRARALAAQGWVHCEADDYFGAPYRFRPELLPEAHAACLRKAVHALQCGADTVVANTFSRKWEMQPYIDAGKLYGAHISIIECDGDYLNVHGVSDAAITRMRARWEPCKWR